LEGVLRKYAWSLSKERVLPTGHCWCGCVAETGIGAFFTPGHDKIGESAIIKVVYGSVPEKTSRHGFGPGGRNAHMELEDYRKKGGKYL
jgi:hypothetical protein